MHGRRLFSSFSSLGVPSLWLPRLAALRISTPTAAQSAALPHLFASRGVVLRAETGSGKTLAYLLPILESLRARIAARDASAQLLPVALVLVPSDELVAQVVGVARALYPEQAAMVRAASGLLGVTRGMNAGVVVATPRGAADAVHDVHKSELKFVVIDEADALLSGGFADVMRSRVLVPFKSMAPDVRPAHVFCAATLATRGKRSVGAFIDKFYSEDDCVRIVTPGVHRPIERINQAFWHVDACVPLTATEVRRAAAPPPAELDVGLSVAAVAAEGREGSDGDGGVSGAEEQDSDGAVDDDDGVEEEHDGRSDAVADAMADRVSEDELLADLAEEKRYADKAAALTRWAVIDALLRPAAVLGVAAETPSDASMRAARASNLESLAEGRAPSAATQRKEKRAVLRGAVSRFSVEDFEGVRAGIEYSGDADGAAADGARDAWLKRYTPPGGTTRPKLTDAESALIPPTLIFVNSASGADSLRRFLAAAIPGVRVSELHSEIPASARQARLLDFVNGAIRILVSTNLGARGLDTTHVAHVIQADFAGDVVTHLHRIGRTARAGRAGMATALCLRKNLPLAQAIVRAQQTGVKLDAVFSRKRSFRKRTKQTARNGVLQAARIEAQAERNKAQASASA
jgi:superfamily II DNA/RNA helicase